MIAARLAGARSITVSDILDRPLAQAREVGADRTIRADLDRDALAAPQFDVCYEVSGSFVALKSCVAAAKRGGTIVQVGTLPHEPLPFVVNELMAKELDLQGRVPLGHRVRLGGRLPVVAPRRRPAAAVGPVSVAGRRQGVRAGEGQDAEHEGASGVS